MDAKERYFWDLTGHLVVPQVLSPDEIAEANEAIDPYYTREILKIQDSDDLPGRPDVRTNKVVRTSNKHPYFLEMPSPYSDPFRKMLAHPQIVSRLNKMCGRGFRLDHGPELIGRQRRRWSPVARIGRPPQTLCGLSQSKWRNALRRRHGLLSTVRRRQRRWRICRCTGIAQIQIRHTRRPQILQKRHGCTRSTHYESGRCTLFHGRRANARHLALASRTPAPIHPLQIHQQNVCPAGNRRRNCIPRALLGSVDHRWHDT